MSKICKNGIIRDRTVQEEADLVAHREQNAIYDAAKEDARAAAVAKKASGKQKLKDLGLDDEEIKELTGA